jgi:hypothetical protein
MNALRKYVIPAAAAALALTVLATPSPSSATVIDFEDVSYPGCCTFPTAGHQGFTWSGGNGGGSWVIAQESANVFSGIDAHSGVNYVWSNVANDLSLADETYDFISMWARIGNSTTGTAIAHGFNGATELYTQTLNLTDTYQLFNLYFNGITNWTLTNQLNNVLIDDICVNDQACGASQVPEPGTLVLIGAGLAAFGYLIRRKRGLVRRKVCKAPLKISPARRFRRFPLIFGGIRHNRSAG